MRKNIKYSIALSYLKLLKEKPLNDISTQQIADMAGISKRTLYNYFPDKYEILSWFWDYWMKDVRAEAMHKYSLRKYELFIEHREAMLKVFAYIGQNNLRDIILEDELKKFNTHIDKGILSKYGPQMVDYIFVTLRQQLKYNNYRLLNTEVEKAYAFLEDDPVIFQKALMSHALSEFFSDEPLPEGKHL